MLKLVIQYANGAKERAVNEILEPLASFLSSCQSKNPADRPNSIELTKKLIERYKMAANFL